MNRTTMRGSYRGSAATSPAPRPLQWSRPSSRVATCAFDAPSASTRRCFPSIASISVRADRWDSTMGPPTRGPSPPNACLQPSSHAAAFTPSCLTLSSALSSGLTVAARPAGRRRGGSVLSSLLPPAATPAAAAAAEAEAEREVSHTCEDSGLTVTMRKIRTFDELRQVATLRADAYYAENQSRFVGSLKKKFVEQEVESLQQRTTIMSKQGTPYSECLVSVDAASGAVLGCIDMRLPSALNGMHPQGVPQDDPHGCYLLNVVVREDVRGRGLGRALMLAAMARAVRVWAAQQLYTHVEADNEVAFRLYNGCGFEKHSSDSKYEAASKLGQTVLLKAPAAAAGAGVGGQP